MNLPFTQEQFLEIFANYNLSVWPMQIFFVVLALVMILFLVKRNSYSDKLISWGLTFFWLWIGIVYHLIFFTEINPAANLFGILFILQGILFLHLGIIKKSMQFEFRIDINGIFAIIFFIYALIIYPLLGLQFGHYYPKTPTFGLPCPTTIFTFGLLLMLKQQKKLLYIIPIMWSIIGFTAAIKLGIFQDIGLFAAGAAAIGILILNAKKK